MDVVTLSRLQFGAAAMFHFLFVPLTLGLTVLVAVMETMYVRTGDRTWLRMAKFWGRLFIINFALGVVTGITLEFQFGTNWAPYSKFVGDVFGSLLAIEATMAFFLESTFLAVWIFGWNRVSPKVHALSIWLVAIGSNLSALWILAANAFMQHPVGYKVDPETGRAVLTDFWALLLSGVTINSFIHTISASFILTGFFIMGVSAYHLMKGKETKLFQRSFRLAAAFSLLFTLTAIVQGHVNGAEVAEVQPAKLAAMEALWETAPEGVGAPQTLFLIPDEKHERNLVEAFQIPGALSLLAYHRLDAEVKGLKEWPPEDRPPVLVTFLAFRAMVGLGFLFPLIVVLGGVLYGPESLMKLPGLARLRQWLQSYPRLPWLFILAIPLPYVAIQSGWVLTEMGRQPWIVYGVTRTAHSASTLAVSQVLWSLAGFLIIYSLLGLADFFLLFKYSVRGPEPETEGGEG